MEFRDPENEEPPGLADRGFFEKWAFRLDYSWTCRSLVSTVRPSCVPHTNAPAARFLAATQIGWVGMKVCMIRSYVPQGGSLRQETILVFWRKGRESNPRTGTATRFRDERASPTSTPLPRWWPPPESNRALRVFSATLVTDESLMAVAEGGGVEPRARRSSR